MTKEYIDLITKIIYNTRNKKIVWEQTSDEDRFKTKIGSGVVAISREDIWDGGYVPENTRYTLSIINDAGILAENISIYENSSSLEESYKQLKELYETAKDSYLKINDTIQNMLKELDELDKGEKTLL